MPSVSSHFTYARARASSRRHSEDRAEVFERDDVVVFVVADGAGGIRGGAAAADALVMAVRSAVADNAFGLDDAAAWSEVFRKADAELAAKMSGETTGVLAVLTPRGLLGVSAGDSEAWVITEADIDDLTAAQNKQRLGSGDALPMSFFRPALAGALVVGTDGLFKYAAPAKVAEAARAGDPHQVAEKLIELVRLPSGRHPDDVGILVATSSRGR